MKKKISQRKRKTTYKRAGRAGCKEPITTQCPSVHSPAKLRSQSSLEAPVAPTPPPVSSHLPPAGSFNSLAEIESYLGHIQNYIASVDLAFNEKLCSIYKRHFNSEVSLEMRNILVNWLIEVGHNIHIRSETLHLCIQLVDYVLNYNNQLPRSNLQLLGVTSLFIACKYQEIYIPEASSFIKLCDGLYKLPELLEMESNILIAIDFNLQMPTLQQFTGQFLRVFPQEQHGELYSYVKLISNLVVFSFEIFNTCRKIHVATVVIYLATKLVERGSLQYGFKSKNMMERMGIQENQFRKIYTELISIYKERVVSNSKV